MSLTGQLVVHYLLRGTILGSLHFPGLLKPEEPITALAVPPFTAYLLLTTLYNSSKEKQAGGRPEVNVAGKTHRTLSFGEENRWELTDEVPLNWQEIGNKS